MNIWVNGCFDIIHTGHLDLFEYAKGLYGFDNKLIVGIDSDKRIVKLKGPARPINKQDDRKRMLENLQIVDEVHIFDTSDELCQIIKDSDIGIMVVGDDYKDKKVIGVENSKFGVKYFPVDDRSTTNIIKKL